MRCAGGWTANAVMIKGWVNSRPRAYPGFPDLVSYRVTSVHDPSNFEGWDEAPSPRLTGDFDTGSAELNIIPHPLPSRSKRLLGIIGYVRQISWLLHPDTGGVWPRLSRRHHMPQESVVSAAGLVRRT